jgi:hypothetical protein
VSRFYHYNYHSWPIFYASYSWPAVDMNRTSIKASELFITVFICNVKDVTVSVRKLVCSFKMYLCRLYIFPLITTRVIAVGKEGTCNFALRYSDLHSYVVFRRSLVICDRSSSESRVESYCIPCYCVATVCFVNWVRKSRRGQCTGGLSREEASVQAA